MYELWRRGEAWRALLDSAGPTGGQQRWFRDFESAQDAAFVWLIGRQRGKSFAAVFDAVHSASTHRNWILRYCALTKDSCAGIVRPAIASIVETMPPEMRPTQHGEYLWRFPTGSELVIFGTDAESFRRGRGPKTHRQYLDECGFYQDLEAVDGALIPSLQTTRGNVLYLSTPPLSLGHTFVERINSARASGRLVHDTLHNNPRVDPDGVIAFEMSRLGQTREQLVSSSYFRREYLAELVPEETRAAIPCWSADTAARVVGEWARPVYFDAYVSVDPGKIGDPHAALFAFFDPVTSTVTIEDELEVVSARTTVSGLAQLIKDRERTLYGTEKWTGKLLGAPEWQKEFGLVPEYLRSSLAAGAERQPFLRVGDNDGLLLNALCAEHGIAVLPTRKDDKHLAVDQANNLLMTSRVRIHARCRRLIEQLYSTVWNRSRTHWERTGKDHGDLIDCLVYLLRNVRWHHDCRPPSRSDLPTTVVKPSGWESAFGVRAVVGRAR